MRVMPVVAAIAVGIGLLGCVTNGDTPGFGLDPDGLRCDFPVVDGRVHIEIRYAANGTPSAVPEDCTVGPGTRITWRGPDDNAAPFAIAFPGASPEAMRDSRGRLASDSVQERQKIVIVAGDNAGRYKYEIAANGIVVDPAIIIRP